ncbi:hypothetical protein [Aerococcus sp. UMB9870]|uniref:hypothetical protein n=1 Tax=Aerococcus sp. UMB9870 TaxID=3046351 RepID=UPI00254D7BA8|nr:hypothetical protein [Aerococcus sp. UMB9870]MDK6370009.1 hypothetical protein [Aerococcus sp. UMB9870]
MGRHSSNQKRVWRLAYALALTGLGYAYHALSQGRSVRSKLLSDKHKLAQAKDYWQSSDQVQEKLSRQSKELGDGLLDPDQAARYNMDLKQTEAGPYYEMLGANSQGGPALIYWHGGKRVKVVTDREWHFLKQVVDRLQLRCYIPVIQPLTLRKVDAEADRLKELVQEILRDKDVHAFHFLASESGAVFSLALAPYFQEGLEGQVLLSPWFASGGAELGGGLEDQVMEEAFDAEALDALLDQTEFSREPATDFIVGTEDSEQAASLRTYRRLRAKGVACRFYRFDLMPADFYLYAMPEQEEVMDLLDERLKESLN